jgi:ankyrin repeat protein
MRKLGHRFRRTNESIYQTFKYAINDNDISKVKELLKDPQINPEQEHSWSLRYACSFGRYNIVKLLLEDGRADPTVFIQSCVKIASEENHPRILRLLLKDTRVIPESDENYALEIAAAYGNFTCFKLLLNDERTSAYNNEKKSYESLLLASDKGHFDIVNLLLKDKKIRYSKDVDQAFRNAFSERHYKTSILFLYKKCLKKEIKLDEDGIFKTFKLKLKILNF